MAWIVAHHRLPLLLRHQVLAQVERLGDPNPVLRLLFVTGVLSDSGEPIMNSPAGIRTISNFTSPPRSTAISFGGSIVVSDRPFNLSGRFGSIGRWVATYRITPSNSKIPPRPAAAAASRPGVREARRDCRFVPVPHLLKHPLSRLPVAFLLAGRSSVAPSRPTDRPSPRRKRAASRPTPRSVPPPFGTAPRGPFPFRGPKFGRRPGEVRARASGHRETAHARCW